MKIIHSAQDLQKLLFKKKVNSNRIGFIPTMGALHKGHLSLIQASLDSCDITVVSIFVNPTQFSPNEDFDAYPRPEKEDSDCLESLGVDYLFMPSVQEMYPSPLDRTTQVTVPYSSHIYCAQTRPTIFTGASTVVCRLLNIVQADKAFFGEKDFQQYHIIKQMAKDLFIPTDIILSPIVREPSGLAMSSRNRNFSEKQLEQAATIYKALSAVNDAFKSGKTQTTELELLFTDYVTTNSPIDISYIALIDPITLEKKNTAQFNDRLLFAGYLDKIRLIDNLALKL
jgi:pantoate--beta-alanine ligase